jgi:ATP-dependent RNA helicase DDX27
MDVDALIAAKRKSFQKDDEKAAVEKEEAEKEEAEESDEESSDDSDSDDQPADNSHADLEDDVIKTRAGKEQQVEEEVKEDSDDHGDDDEEEEEGSGSSDEEDDETNEASKAAAFFDVHPSSSATGQPIEVFNQLNLSRPLLRGVAAMGFVKPTPIQTACLPLALAGRDICASAVTGSGKTAAFVLPMLEKLLHARYTGRTKAVILTPTRELAAQCLGMLTTFAQFTKIRAVLIVGGTKNVQAQAAELRTKPEIVVATPGRLLDHVTNSTGFTLQDVEFLILDEADRLLDLGFQDEVHEIVKTCPPARRQTLLFSATMNTKVDDLVNLSLKRPVRVHITDKKNNKSIEVAPRLEQEFIRIRAGNEGLNREGMLLALLTRTFAQQTIVFFDTKVTAHRLMILCGLCGIKCTELHGNLTQQQRLTALDDFTTSKVDVLLATDLAARGLDMDRVETVINFEMPNQIESYVHRIGRTARAGRGGRSCTLIGEGRRHLMKELIKDAESKPKSDGTKNGPFKSGVIRSRSIPAAVVVHFVNKIKSLESHVEEILQAEVVARMDRIVEMEAIKAQNIIERSDEIKARPAREWFTSNHEKMKLAKDNAVERARLIQEKAGTGMHRMTRKKRRGREALEDFAEANADDGDEDGERDHRAAQPVNIKSAARNTKRKNEEQEKEKLKMSLNDQTHVKEVKLKKKFKAQDSAGDSSLFAEEKVALAPKPANEKAHVIKSAYEFRGFKPDLKLGKKQGHSSFKSKSKFKRRK